MPPGPDKVLNPITKRYIKIGSQLYRKLVKDGVIVIEAPVQGNQPQPQNNNNAGKVENPKTGRWIKVNSKTYKELVKQGISFDGIDNKKKKTKVEPIRHKHKCKNDSTYVYLMSTKDIEIDDLFVTPSGHCFSIQEMVDWVSSTTFKNENPYDSKSEMFNLKDKSTWTKNPLLRTAIQDYIDKKIAESDSITRILKDNIDLLWKIGNTGCVCKWDYLYSHERGDSSVFEYSISKLEELSTLIGKLKDKEKILSFTPNGNLSIEEIIKSADNGQMCIHGIGNSLIYIFCYFFNLMDTKYDIEVDFEKLGFCFLKERNKTPPTILSFSSNILFKWEIMNEHKKLFKPLSFCRDIHNFEDCNNEAYLSSIDSVDKWIEVPTWRRIKIDGMCFDLYFLIKMIEEQLCSIKSYNPSPKYPTNPFNNKPFSILDLIDIKRRIGMTNLRLPYAINLFLSSIMHLWSDDVEYISSNEWKEKFVSHYEKNLRYERACFNDKVSDIMTTLDVRGYWVPKHYPSSPNEQALLSFLDTMNLDVFNKRLKSSRAKDKSILYYISFVHLYNVFSVQNNYKSIK